MNESQSIWYIDPQNPLANNANVGNLPSQPVKTWNGGVIAKYGTTSPILPQDVDYVFLSDSPDDGSDPIVFTPTMILGARPRFLGDLTAAITGTIAGFTPKAYGAFAAPGNLPSADLSPGIAQGMLVENLTKPSRAFVRRNVGGTTWELYQPMALADSATLTAPAFVDNWTPGDSFVAYSLTEVEFLKLEPIWGDLGLNRAIIQNLAIKKLPGAQAGQAFFAGDAVCLLECRCDRRLVMTRSAFDRNSVSLNSIYTDPIGISGGVVATGLGTLVIGVPGPRFFGGGGGFNLVGAVIDGNFVVETYDGSSSAARSCAFGTVYLGTSITTSDMTPLGRFGYDQARIWGPGAFTQDEGKAWLADNSAVNVFLNGALSIGNGSKTTGFTINNLGVIVANVPVTPANIDANNDPVGVGIFSPVGGAFTNLG